VSPASQPSVSIVLATHNRREWLRLAMDSVLAQSYPDLELVVMDDGSTDETPELLAEYSRRYPPERFRFSRHENMGQARTLNRGYEMARGEILGYLSDDDLLAGDAVARLVTELRDPEVVAVYPGYRMIDETGKIVDTVRPVEYSPLEAFRLHDTIIGPGGLVRREALESTGGWDPSLHWMGDLMLWMGVGRAGRVVLVPEPLASWRRHPAGITLQTSLQRAREHLRLAELGASLLDLPSDATAIRAEALRNACVIGAFFGGDPGDGSSAPHFMAIDLQRPEISALAAGVGPEAVLDESAAEAARLWRELAGLVVEVAETRARQRGPDEHRLLSAPSQSAGVEAASERLRGVGVLPVGPDAVVEDLSHRAVQTALWESAFECGADTRIDTSRYLLIDREDGLLGEDELGELTANAFQSSIPGLRQAIARYRREIEPKRTPS
jgi:hypothetical protein